MPSRRTRGHASHRHSIGVVALVLAISAGAALAGRRAARESPNEYSLQPSAEPSR